MFMLSIAVHTISTVLKTVEMHKEIMMHLYARVLLSHKKGNIAV